MSNYIDLVLVKITGGQTRKLFMAPVYHVFSGDDVICQTASGEESGKVIATMSCLEDSQAYKFALTACGAREPLKKVLFRLDRTALKYQVEKKQRTNRDVVIDLLRNEGMSVTSDTADAVLFGAYCKGSYCARCHVNPEKKEKGIICDVDTFTDWADCPAESLEDNADVPF